MRITRTSDLTPEVLTDILTTCGVLQNGRVTAVTLDMESSQKGYVSHVATFQVTYSSEVGEEAPSRLFLKITKPDVPEFQQAGRHEIAFYTAILPASQDLPVPRCYYVEGDANSDNPVLLMADLSQSHFQRPLPIPPAPEHCRGIMESLARIHAHWWGHPGLGKTVGTPLSLAEAEASRKRLEASVPDFMDYLGDALLPAQRSAYARILESSFLQRRAQRLHAQRTVTLIHGDAHSNNLMLPNNPAKNPVLLIDWQRWGIDVPLYDLAFCMAMHWSAERRAALEQPLVRHYYDHLLRHGVTEYRWEDCWNDYRECVIIMALIPIGQFRRRMPMGVVWYGMEQSVAAFLDLACAELL